MPVVRGEYLKMAMDRTLEIEDSHLISSSTLNSSIVSPTTILNNQPIFLYFVLSLLVQINLLPSRIKLRNLSQTYLPCFTPAFC